MSMNKSFTKEEHPEVICLAIGQIAFCVTEHGGQVELPACRLLFS